MQKNSSAPSFCVALNEYSLLRVEGQDAKSFLQGQLSCDLNKLSETQTSLGCCCDRKGRVLFSFRIFVKADVYYLYLPSSILASAIAHLRKYIIIAKVTLEDESCLSLGLGGPEIKTELAKDSPNLAQGFGACAQNDGELLICVDEENPRYLLIGDSLEKYANLPAQNFNDWQFAEIQQGLATVYPETQGLFIPQMLNYDKWDAISFTKGCFVGQEIVARTQHLGKLKRHLQPVEFEKAVVLGEEITRDEKKGVVAAVCLNPEGKYSALVVMQD